ncbi:MAG: BamA/TamA family outer membrane protein, partial [Bacteroidota bacterium]
MASVLLGLSLFSVHLLGQVQLQIHSSDFSWEEKVPSSFADTVVLTDFLRNWLATTHNEAYWEASVDSLYLHNEGVYRAVLHRGPRYRWAALVAPKDVPSNWLSKAGFRTRSFRNKPLDHEAWLRIRDSIAVAAADSGYPFATVQLDSIEWLEPGYLRAHIDVSTGPLMVFGELDIPEAARISPTFLQRYLGIQPGLPYNRRLIAEIPRRLRQLPYLRLKGNPTIKFRDQEVEVVLPVERKAASRFDFVIGVLPNSNQTGDLLITGELNGELYNGLGKGERIAAHFEQLRPQTQELELAFDYPYLFDLPFGLSLEGALYRRDTQFINLNYRAAAAYLWQGNNRLEVFWSRRQTNLLGFDAVRVLATQSLPDTLDVGRSFFGVSFSQKRLDRDFAPQRGYALELSASAGTRRIRRNGQLLDLGVEALYDSITLRSAQYEFSTRAALFRPLFPGTVLYLSLDAAAYLGPELLLANEQYRLGGAKLLRGFDEQQIFASSYAVATAEIRLLLTGDAYLYAFGDFAYVDPKNETAPNLAIDFPLGFGAGVSFSTRAGVFGL